MFEVIAVLVILVVGWVLLRFVAPSMNRQVSIGDTVILLLMRKFALPIFYLFVVSIMCMQFSAGRHYESVQELLIMVLVIMPLFFGFAFGLSGLVVHWMLNDFLSKSFKEGAKIKDIERFTKIKNSVRRWRWFHKLLFKMRGLSIDDVFVEFGLDGE